MTNYEHLVKYIIYIYIYKKYNIAFMKYKNSLNILSFKFSLLCGELQLLIFIVFKYVDMCNIHSQIMSI